MESVCVFKLGFRCFMQSIADEAIKFPLALSENSKLAFVEEAYVPVGFQKVFSKKNNIMLIGKQLWRVTL